MFAAARIRDCSFKKTVSGLLPTGALIKTWTQQFLRKKRLRTFLLAGALLSQFGFVQSLPDFPPASQSPRRVFLRLDSRSACVAENVDHDEHMSNLHRMAQRASTAVEPFPIRTKNARAWAVSDSANPSTSDYNNATVVQATSKEQIKQSQCVFGGTCMGSTRVQSFNGTSNSVVTGFSSHHEGHSLQQHWHAWWHTNSRYEDKSNQRWISPYFLTGKDAHRPYFFGASAFLSRRPPQASHGALSIWLVGGRGWPRMAHIWSSCLSSAWDLSSPEVGPNDTDGRFCPSARPLQRHALTSMLIA